MSVESEKMLIRAAWTWFTLTCVHCARLAWYMGISLFVAAAVALTVFRYWLPTLAEQKGEIETLVSQQLGEQVTIGQMTAVWQGVYPALVARDLALLGEDGRTRRLGLDEIRLQLDLVPLLQRRFAFREISLVRPLIEVTRTPAGEFRIGNLVARAGTQPTTGERLVAILMAQEHVTIEDGVLVWDDQQLDEAPLEISQINMIMRNDKDRHRFDGTITLPAHISRDIVLSLDLTGNPLRDPHWDGRLHSRIGTLDLAALPGILTERLALPSPAGLVSLDLNSHWADGRLASASGRIEASDVLVPLGRFGDSFRIGSLGAQMDLQRQADDWQLRLDKTRLATSGTSWDAGSVDASYADSGATLRIGRLELAELRPVLDAISHETRLTEMLKALYPAGEGIDATLELSGNPRQPDDIVFDMHFRDAAVGAYRLYPAADGLSGHLRIGRDSGVVVAQLEDAAVVLERVFEAPLPVRRAGAKVSWLKGETAWRVQGENVWVDSEDGRAVAQFSVDVPLDRSLEPRLELDAELHDGNLVNAARYFPVRLLQPNMVSWLQATRFRGRADHARLKYAGSARGFPIRGAERFDLVANLGSTGMFFAPGWPRLSGIEGDLVVTRTDLWVKGSAKDLAGQEVEEAVVHLAPLDVPEKLTINVQSRMQGDTSRLVDFLRNGPLFGNTPFSAIDLAGEGHGSLALTLALPLRDARNARVEGRYEPLGSRLQLPNATWLTDLQGELSFTEDSVMATAIKGRYLGGEVSMDVETIRPGRPPEVVIEMAGQSAGRELGPIVGDWLASGLDGLAAWRGTLSLGDGPTRLSVQSDLADIRSDLPPPLRKEVGVRWPLVAEAEFKPGAAIEVRFSSAGRLRGDLSLARSDDTGSSPGGGCIRIGDTSAVCPDSAGLAVIVNAEQIDLDGWNEHIGRQPGGDGSIPPILTHIAGSTPRLRLFGSELAQVEAVLRRRGEAWRGEIDGHLVKGTVDFSWSPGDRRVALDLQRLSWPVATDADVENPQRTDPASFPVLDVKVAEMQFHDMQLGQLSLQGGPTARGWELNGMSIVRPDMRISARGRWRAQAGGHNSNFDVDFSSTDMLATLAALQINAKIDTSQFRVSGYLAWPDMPSRFDMAILNGMLEFHADKGRLASVEVGAGRLLGALNIDTVRRRLLLDFSDLFKEGYAFDSIDGELDIKAGQATVSRLQLPGPSAAIHMKGRLGLAQRDLDMRMAVIPAVGGNLAIAGFALGGPVAGVATYLAQRVIQEQMNKTIDYRYHVTGSWDEPVVDKLPQPAGATGNTPQG